MASRYFFAGLECKTLAMVLGLSMAMDSARAEDYALIVGVGKFESPGVSSLAGVEHDFNAVRKDMMELFRIPPSRIIALQDKQATRQRILSALDNYKSDLKKGDRLFFYFSGHGTSVKNRGAGQFTRLLPYQSGAVLPYDAVLNGGSQAIVNSLIVGRRDLFPRLSTMDEKGVKVYAFFDSCYSGNAVRSVNLAEGFSTRQQTIGFDQDDLEDEEDCDNCEQEPMEQPYPYKNVFFLSAAAETEVALDIDHKLIEQYPTVDKNYHGAFTDALLRSWRGKINSDSDGDGNLSMLEIGQSVSCFMESRGYGHDPQLLPSKLQDMDGSRLPLVSVSQNTIDSGVSRIDKNTPIRKWISSLRSLACSEAGLDTVLQIGLSGYGSTYRFGEKVPIFFKSKKQSHWLMFNIDSDDTITVLYPELDEEFKSVPANDTVAFPASAIIEASPPAGVDTVVAIAFHKKPDFYKSMAQSLNGGYGSEMQKKLEEYLNSNKDRFGISIGALRTVKN